MGDQWRGDANWELCACSGTPGFGDHLHKSSLDCTLLKGKPKAYQIILIFGKS